jgi:hypothetical protein
LLDNGTDENYIVNVLLDNTNYANRKVKNHALRLIRRFYNGRRELCEKVIRAMVSALRSRTASLAHAPRGFSCTISHLLSLARSW